MARIWGARIAHLAQDRQHRLHRGSPKPGNPSESTFIPLATDPLHKCDSPGWFRGAGGMSPKSLAPSAKPPSGRYLVFAEREEIALCRAQGQGTREIARRLGRAASTISRELRRNAATRGGGLEYRASTAQWHAERAARRPKRAKLATNAALRTYVQEHLSAQSPPRAGLLWLGRPWPGRAAGTGRGRHGAGPRRGARSKSPGACGATSLVTRPCASATRRSIRRFTCRGAGRCGAS